MYHTLCRILVFAASKALVVLLLLEVVEGAAQHPTQLPKARVI